MNLQTAHDFVCDYGNYNLRKVIQRLADEDLPPSGVLMDGLMEAAAGEYRDVELILDLAGNLDAPL